MDTNGKSMERCLRKIDCRRSAQDRDRMSIIVPSHRNTGILLIHGFHNHDCASSAGWTDRHIAGGKWNICCTIPMPPVTVQHVHRTTDLIVEGHHTEVAAGAGYCHFQCSVTKIASCIAGQSGRPCRYGTAAQRDMVACMPGFSREGRLSVNPYICVDLPQKCQFGA